MKRYRYWDEQNMSDQLVKILQAGKIVAGDSDTVIGLLAPLTPEGSKRLDQIKQRKDKPYLILVGDRKKAARFSSKIRSTLLQPLLDACWPGPLTVIVPAHETVPDFMQSKSGAIAVRVPDHQGLQKLLQSFDGLFSTSANRSGETIPDTIKAIDPGIASEVACIIADRKKDARQPSTIIDYTGDQPHLIREGAYSRQFLRQYLNTV